MMFQWIKRVDCSILIILWVESTRKWKGNKMTKVKVSVIILAKNEERNIEDCIERVISFADEVLVIDDGSTDKTVAISEGLGAKVLSHPLNGDWGQQKNFAMDNAANDWVLLLDADERISEPLAREIVAAVSSGDKLAYDMHRENRFHHNRATHGILRPDRVPRLFPKEGSRVEGKVHETVITPYPMRSMKGAIYHYTYDNWDQYFGKFNNYTRLAAEKSLSQGKHASFLKDIVLRPLWAFIKIYFINGGFLDGKLGWIFSVNHYFYTMTKYVRLYYLERTNGKL